MQNENVYWEQSIFVFLTHSGEGGGQLLEVLTRALPSQWCYPVCQIPQSLIHTSMQAYFQCVPFDCTLR